MTYPAVKIPIQAKDRRLESLVLQGGIERRERIRFPLELRARYRTLERRRPLVGRGWVMNMSSGGVLVASSHEISTGTGLELSIEWPFLLDGRVPLQLVASATPSSALFRRLGHQRWQTRCQSNSKRQAR